MNKKDFLFLLGFLGLLAVFYPGLWLAKQASLMGDHWEQHYPWAFLMAQSLKQGIVPFWIPWIQCGFPIAAESQMGLFYLPNLLFYTILPIQWAYSYMNLVHFFIAGLGTYLYCRKMGLVPAGAFAAAAVFVFGTGYGGAYYNITSLKTLAWFPWILWVFEMFCVAFRKRYVVLAAFFMALSILAGYLQVAAFMLLICAVYFLLRIFMFQEDFRTWGRKLQAGGGMVFAVLGAIVLSLPQLILTFELALLSNRVALSPDYAFVGSLSPVALLTFVFPMVQGLLRGNCLYSGIFALYFAIAAFSVAQKDARRMLWLWMTVGIISLFLALGQWSPLYVGLIKLTRFYSFRVPAKFLIFVCFSVAILAGIGVHAFQEELFKDEKNLNALGRRWTIFVGMVVAMWGVVYFFVSAGQRVAEQIGRWVVIRFIYGKSGHPRSLESYFDAVRSGIAAAREMLSPANPWLLWALMLLLFCCVWMRAVPRLVKRPHGVRALLALALLVLLADLYVFASQDIKRDFDLYKNVLKPDSIVQALIAERDAGRLGRIYGFRKESERLPLVPSVNILYRIEDVGGYSPFIMRRYFETVGRFGNVNDSNQMIEPTVPFVLERLPLLDALDVSHILSTQELRHPSLELQIHDPASGAFLYRNRGSHKRAFFVATAISFANWPLLKRTLLVPGFDPQKVLLLENSEKAKLRGILLSNNSKATQIVRLESTQDREVWILETTGPGFFVMASTMYPGWEARIEGQKTPLLSAYGLFRTVWIPKAGKHRVELRYNLYHNLKFGLG